MDEERITKIKNWLLHNWYIALAVLIVVPLLGFLAVLHTRGDNKDFAVSGPHLIIVQEGMTNASRHGHASHVGISLVGNGSSLEIVIADDGIGCQKVKKGFGLHHMQERLELLGGTLRFWSEKGFVLEICIPLNREWKQSGV